MSNGDSTAPLPDDLEAGVRAVAREEAQAVYGDLTAVDGDGKSVTLAGIQHRIADLAPEMSRRELLKTSVVAFGYVASGAGLGAGIMHALSQPAAADASGEYGTASDPLKFVRTQELNGGGSNVTIGDTLVPSASEELGTSASPFGAIITDDLVFNGDRIERGTVTHSDPGAPSDGSWNSNELDSQSVSFANAFSTAPDVVISADRVDTGTVGVKNISTTGFDSVYRQMASAFTGAPTVSWLALGPE
jgi:hypothetical protein